MRLHHSMLYFVVGLIEKMQVLLEILGFIMMIEALFQHHGELDTIKEGILSVLLVMALNIPVLI